MYRIWGYNRCIIYDKHKTYDKSVIEEKKSIVRGRKSYAGMILWLCIWIMIEICHMFQATQSTVLQAAREAERSWGLWPLVHAHQGLVINSREGASCMVFLPWNFDILGICKDRILVIGYRYDMVWYYSECGSCCSSCETSSCLWNESELELGWPNYRSGMLNEYWARPHSSQCLTKSKD